MNKKRIKLEPILELTSIHRTALDGVKSNANGFLNIAQLDRRR